MKFALQYCLLTDYKILVVKDLLCLFYCPHVYTEISLVWGSTCYKCTNLKLTRHFSPYILPLPLLITATSLATKLSSYLSLLKVGNYAQHFHMVPNSKIKKTSSGRPVRNWSQFGQSEQLFQVTEVLSGTSLNQCGTRIS